MAAKKVTKMRQNFSIKLSKAEEKMFRIQYEIYIKKYKIKQKGLIKQLKG